MSYHYLIVDGMTSGTGIRDAEEGGYIEPNLLGISQDLCQRIAGWQSKYELAHFNLYSDKGLVDKLDIEGLELAKAVLGELPNCKVRYFSDATMQEIAL
jgi:hypothetical protein